MASEPKSTLTATVSRAIKTGDLEAADKFVRQALAENPLDLAAWESLVMLQTATEDLHGLRESLEHLDRAVPLHVDALITLSKVKNLLGDREGALAVLRRARADHPRNAEVAVELFNLAGPADLDTAAADLRVFMASVSDDPHLVSTAAAILAQIRYRAARLRAGKSAKFGESWDDVLGWGDPEGLAEYRAALLRELEAGRVRPATVAQLGAASLAARDWTGAESFYARLRGRYTSLIWDAITFDVRAWDGFSAQSTADVLKGLPPCEVVRTSAPTASFSLLLPSDPVYCRRYTLPLLESLGRFAPRLDVHVHLLDGEPEEWEQIGERAAAAFGSGLTVTAERSGAHGLGPLRSREYYHALRFVRFHEFLVRSGRACWMMDVDADFRGDPTVHFSRLLDADIALWVEATDFPPARRVFAGIFGAAASPAGVGFSRLAAAYIAALWRQGRLKWGVDQLALYGAAVHLARTRALPSAYFVDRGLVSHNSSCPEAVINFNSGAKKIAALKGAGSGG